jgi:putative ABC transport system permease protein
MGNRGYPVSLYLAVRAIRRGNRGTLVLTILLIALMVVLMNFMVMVMGSMITQYYQQIIDYQYGDVIIIPQDKQTYIDNVADLVDRLQRIPGVGGVSARLTTGVTITNPKTGVFQPESLTAFNPDDEKTVTRYNQKIIAGDFLSKDDTDKILIGVLLAGNDDATKDKLPSLGGVTVGDLVTVAYNNGMVKTYRIKGIYQTDNALNDAAAFISRNEMDTILHSQGRATAVIVRGTDPSLDPAYALQLKYTLMQFGVQDQVKTWAEKGKALLEDSLGSLQKIEYLITLVGLIVASMVVFVITFINITNRQKQIAILKAIGIRRQTIIRNFLVQTFFLCTCGVAVGWLMLEVIMVLLNLYPIKFNLGYVYPTIDYGSFALSILSLYLVSLISGYLPARTVANEDILEAMRG